MKFKWIGGNGHKDIDLVLHKVMKPSQQLFKGTIVDVPDSNKELLQRIQINANYEAYNEPKKVKLPKKEKTEEKKEEK